MFFSVASATINLMNLILRSTLVPNHKVEMLIEGGESIDQEGRQFGIAAIALPAYSIGTA